jgi:carbonic anhydrase
MIYCRRVLFGRALIAAATATVTGLVREPAAQTSLTPDAALQQLIDGNRRFTEGRMISSSEDLKALRARTAEKQEPFAAVLSCADSRVPVELIFDQSIGHVFVTRVAGNIASSAIIASLEYAVAVLGTKALMVLGHANCGAVKAAVEAKEVPGQISTLYPYIRPAVDQAGRDLEAAIKANAKIQAALLRQSSPVLAEHIKQNQLKIAAGFYDLATGLVSMLE